MDTKNQKDNRKLVKSIQKLNKSLERSTSFKYVFLRGIINGLATAIGATIVAGAILSILSRTIDSVDDVPVLGEFIEAIKIREVIEDGK